MGKRSVGRIGSSVDSKLQRKREMNAGRRREEGGARREKRERMLPEEETSDTGRGEERSNEIGKREKSEKACLGVVKINDVFLNSCRSKQGSNRKGNNVLLNMGNNFRPSICLAGEGKRGRDVAIWMVRREIGNFFINFLEAPQRVQGGPLRD